MTVRWIGLGVRGVDRSRHICRTRASGRTSCGRCRAQHRSAYTGDIEGLRASRREMIVYRTEHRSGGESNNGIAFGSHEVGDGPSRRVAVRDDNPHPKDCSVTPQDVPVEPTIDTALPDLADS